MKKHFRRLQKAFFGHAQGREMNREKIRSEFQSYVSHYDPSDPKIRLKIDHTYRVADLCERIAGSLSLSEEMTEISWICGMLHFESENPVTRQQFETIREEMKRYLETGDERRKGTDGN